MTSKMIWNERTKLLAGLLQSGATTSLALGFLAPLAALVYHPGAVAAAPIGAGVLIWVTVAATFHAMAHAALGMLRE